MVRVSGGLGEARWPQGWGLGGKRVAPLQTFPNGESEAGLSEAIVATASPASVVGHLRLVLGE